MSDHQRSSLGRDVMSHRRLASRSDLVYGIPRTTNVLAGSQSLHGTGVTVADTQLKIAPIGEGLSLKARAYEALKAAITNMNIYADDAELRLDERDLVAALRREPHAAARGPGAARPGRAGQDRRAPRHLHRAQDQGRDPRHDHGLGGARKHGRAARDQAGRLPRNWPDCTLWSTSSPRTRSPPRWANTPTPTSGFTRPSSD